MSIMRKASDRTIFAMRMWIKLFPHISIARKRHAIHVRSRCRKLRKMNTT